ncbi:hypothetical protein J6590_026939 [Homalodisca vitripennis]|nr:hypothetical protein J6590_026939 [Homalodisca vitripennis]
MNCSGGESRLGNGWQQVDEISDPLVVDLDSTCINCLSSDINSRYADEKWHSFLSPTKPITWAVHG